jgi:excisionase family DNA binding protein
MTNASEFLTVREVSKQLHIGVDIVVSHIDNGRLQAINVGTKTRRSFRIRREWLEDFVRSSLVQTEVQKSGAKSIPKLESSRWIRKLNLQKHP